VADPGVLLERVKRDSNQLAHADGAHVDRMLASVATVRYAGGSDGRLAPVAVRGLALAALAAAGQAGEDNADRLEPLLADGASFGCLHMAKLNLFQCMAVAGPQYEDLFCAGQHAMIDTGKCVVAQVGDGADAGPVLAAARAEPEPDVSERTVAERGVMPSAPTR